jgi:hypothetical protein
MVLLLLFVKYIGVFHMGGMVLLPGLPGVYFLVALVKFIIFLGNKFDQWCSSSGEDFCIFLVGELGGLLFWIPFVLGIVWLKRKWKQRRQRKRAQGKEELESKKEDID